MKEKCTIIPCLFKVEEKKLFCFLPSNDIRKKMSESHGIISDNDNDTNAAAADDDDMGDKFDDNDDRNNCNVY